MKDAPIQRKIMMVIMMTTGAVLLLICVAFSVYEFYAFRQTQKTQLSTLGKIIAANSTAALAFDSAEDAQELLHALNAEKQIVAAALFDEDGKLFAHYAPDSIQTVFPDGPGKAGFTFSGNYLEGFQPVIQNRKYLGSLYLRSNMEAMYARIGEYAEIGFLVILIAYLFGYLLSIRLQKSVSRPILSLAETARIVSERHDYSVRATKVNEDELGLLTDAFNYMLSRIESQSAQIKTFNLGLEQKVRERTLDLEVAKNELQTLNDQLIQSNRDLEQFAYVASHDLQEPLRKIQIFGDMALTKIKDQEAVTAYLEKIRSSAKRLTELTVGVLNYSRLSKITESFSDIDLNQVIDNIRNDLEMLIAEKNAVIEHGQLPVISGFPLQINQLFLNLISNSLKFSHQPPLIRISCHNVQRSELPQHPELNSGTQYVELVFSDNGIGFDQQYADLAFNIFQRLHDRQHYPGTGIGLALCKKIVENHFGFIRVKSEVGKGTVFYICLPVNIL